MSAVDPDALRAALAGSYAAVDVVEQTGSTNADLVAAADAGAADRTVLVAGAQTLGRGRRDRQWVSPPGGGLYLSVLLRPAEVPAAALGTLAMVAGLALAATASEVAGVAAELKWPNDLLAGGGKCAGVLCEVGGGRPLAVVAGIGLNVGPLGTAPPARNGLPATSLAEQGATETGLTPIAIGLLTRFAELESRWRAAGGDLAAAGLLAPYRERCVTIGTPVRVELPDGSTLTGTGADVAATGRLVVRTEAGTRHPVSAGDVVHVR